MDPKVSFQPGKLSKNWVTQAPNASCLEKIQKTLLATECQDKSPQAPEAVSSESSLKDDLQEVLAPLLRQGDRGGISINQLHQL